MDTLEVILLAGGKSSRFNHHNSSHVSGHSRLKDKLLFRNTPSTHTLLENIVVEIQKMETVLDESLSLYIVTNGESRQNKYYKLLENNPAIESNSIAVLNESRDQIVGPLGGINCALQHCNTTSSKLILAADFPHLTYQTLARFYRQTKKSTAFELIGIVHPNGQVEHLCFTVHTNILAISSELLTLDIYRTSSIIRSLSKKRFLLSTSLVNVDEAISPFNDFDSHADLNQQPRVSPNPDTASIDAPVDFSSSTCRENYNNPCYFYEQYKSWKHGKLSCSNDTIQQILNQEAQIYEQKGLLSLSLHCVLDSLKIQPQKSLLKKTKKLKELL